ncbi:MAG: serine protease [Zetaproteobacteria bacterium CG12_big_fil_rev_8_21_14_0_65_55_1124]|nr:MAG: serine protease [Zetaproteobacteria bacterium CG1_02_55_237]PIS18598.1 MAG: serine protease [Zetaproteobacteria bacterium CG08_land_8_20_14_0_20_55_17]PIW42072.1 MAG: serine protease [Zetaproteobacteria bacterium CG12_big_fil_rev_8_21_14_0_65_55_1124]PIY53979.1 MAG: serine protease [Zetaproteobacteria bacterium CG_4_10_14_0_8_um_filter_55_43]PIZ39424.1 MAG: serine protease [Zetaproteobacteria bacterium CG_4_10_14_0_2_um_filter_55_20]PJB80779.1 MAG: serine protease [Zetaproteobacteria b
MDGLLTQHRPFVCRILLTFALLLMGLPLGHAGNAVVQLEIRGAIGPGVADYVVRGIEQANAQSSQLILLRMDTPGGLDQSMRDIIRAILNSEAPVAAFVAPSGARAASAGTYILYAAHIAAMAPATNLGAATPVQIGGMPGAPQPPSPNKSENPLPEKNGDSGDAMQHKMVNDASAYIRSLAELRGRNADWAEQAVREAASLSADQALKEHVIDLVADDTADLLSQIDGRVVVTAAGQRTLHLDGADVSDVQPDWRDRLLAVITDPNVAYILMLLGIYGLFFELANPGFVLPGVIGGICLLLALFAFQALSVNFAGLALLLLGIAFMIAEAFVPSFGALGLGGMLAFIFGSLMLMDGSGPGHAISLALILGVALSSAIFFILIIGMALKARRRPIVSGSEEMIGASGLATEDFSEQGNVLVHGESWQATSARPLLKGQHIRVVSRDGLTLTVEAKDSDTKEARP